jgi:hypothetical protein
MKLITKRKVFDILRAFPPESRFTYRTFRVAGGDGTVSGSSEHHSLYSYEGRPILLVTVECGSGKCRAYDARK